MLVLNGFLLGTLQCCCGPYSCARKDTDAEDTLSLSDCHGTQSHAVNAVLCNGKDSGCGDESAATSAELGPVRIPTRGNG